MTMVQARPWRCTRGSFRMSSCAISSWTHPRSRAWPRTLLELKCSSSDVAERQTAGHRICLAAARESVNTAACPVMIVGPGHVGLLLELVSTP